MLLNDLTQADFSESLGAGAVLFDTEFEPGEVVLERVERVICTAQTQFQRVDIVETTAYGRTLLLDGALQSTAADERAYHEMLIHPGLVTIDQPRQVLIIGGGEGATLREVLRHNTIQRAVMVDIDGELVEICKRDLAIMHQGAFDDPRAEVRIQDGADFLKASPGQFDLIVYDLTDPGSDLPGPLLSEDFLRLAKSALTLEGMLVMNPFRIGVKGLSPFSLTVRATLQRLFVNVELYASYIHSFLWYCGFYLASDARLAQPLSVDDVDARLRSRGIEDLYAYDGITHQALFSLPRWVRRELK
ncbi:MAG: spermidine synthase [Chloroflexota bacterium]